MVPGSQKAHNLKKRTEETLATATGKDAKIRRIETVFLPFANIREDTTLKGATLKVCAN